MNQQLGIFNGILTAGVVQALAAAWFIGSRPFKDQGSKTLCTLLVVLGLLATKILLHTVGGWQTPYLRYFPLAIDTLVQPLFYCYTCSLTDPDFRLSKKYWRHFLIPALFLLHGVVVYCATFFWGDLAAKDQLADYLDYNRVKWIEDILALFSAVLYWVWCWNKVRRYRQWLYAHESATRYQELAWLRNLLIASAILVLLLAISSLAANIFHWQESFYYLVVFYLYLVGLIYYLSFRGWTAAALAAGASRSVASVKVELPRPLVALQGEDNALHERLLQLMQERKPYLDPELSLTGLSLLVGASAAQVSEVINSGLGQNFRNWINSYRVEEVKARLADPAYAHLNMTGIAFDCGFNSEASFYRIFRHFTGQSPRSWLGSLKKEE